MERINLVDAALVRATRYEVLATATKGAEYKQFRLMFSARKTKTALMEAAQAHGNILLPFLSENQNDSIKYDKINGLQIGANIRVHFGETERACYTMEKGTK
jgi:hypothetical protein